MNELEFEGIGEDEVRPVIVKYKSMQAMTASLKTFRLGLVNNMRISPYSFMNLTLKEAQQLLKSPYVERIELDVPHKIMIEPTPPGYQRLGEPTLADTKLYINGNTGYTGNGVKVAVLDTGVRSTHPMLTGKVVAKFQISDGNIEDNNGHGTWCASCIAGNHVTSPYNMEGMAPNAQIINIKVFNDSGSGSSSIFMRGVEKAVELGADIISYSGGGSDSIPYTADCELIDQMAINYNILCCISAGNSGRFPIGRPSSAKKSISVGSISMKDNTKVYYSSIGPTLLRIVKPDIGAPGGDLTKEGRILGAWLDSYSAVQGTSMACPHMAGILAQLIEKYGRRLTREEIDSLLANTSLTGKNINLGWGKLDCSYLFNPKTSVFSNSKNNTVNISFLRNAQFSLLKTANAISMESGLTGYYNYPQLIILKNIGTKESFFRGGLYRDGLLIGSWKSTGLINPGEKIFFSPYDYTMPAGSHEYYIKVLHQDCSGNVEDFNTPPAVVIDEPIALTAGIHYKIELLTYEEQIPNGDYLQFGFIVRNVGNISAPGSAESPHTIIYANGVYIKGWYATGSIKNPKNAYAPSWSLCKIAPDYLISGGSNQIRIRLYHIENSIEIEDDEKIFTANVI